MYNGFVESAEQIAQRKARILKGYKPPRRTKKPKGITPASGSNSVAGLPSSAK